MIKLPAVFAVLLSCLIQSPTRAEEPAFPEADSGIAAKSLARAGHFMVATAHPEASRIGYEILKAGGSAADAAVAVQLALGLVEPQSSGIGGGAFVLYWDAASQTLTTFDGRETAPATAGPDLFLRPDGTPMGRMEAMVGGRSVGVPGVLKMLEALHARAGHLPWKDLFAAPAALARDGFRVTPRLNTLLAGETALPTQEPAASLFYLPDGSPLPVGHLLKNPAYAKTLDRLAAEGTAPFYEGDIAQAIVDTVHNAKNPGLLTMADMAAYAPVERAPLCGPYRTLRVCGAPPPTSGGIGVVQILGVLDGFSPAELDLDTADGIHRLAEAQRLAFADRAVYIADPAFADVPAAALTSAGYLTRRRALIAPHAAETQPAGSAADLGLDQDTGLYGAPSPELPSTSHFSIVDAQGNVVSMTTSIENAFGSRQMVGGFLLNNQLTDFSYSDIAQGRRVANEVAGGKRPRSSMSPTMVFYADGSPMAAVGSPGGPAIVGFVAKTLIHLIDGGADAQSAVAAPNVLAFSGTGLIMEPGTLTDQEPALVAKGWQVHRRAFASGVHMIVRHPDGTLAGGADPRREGVALGD